MTRLETSPSVNSVSKKRGWEASSVWIRGMAEPSSFRFSVRFRWSIATWRSLLQRRVFLLGYFCGFSSPIAERSASDDKQIYESGNISGATGFLFFTGKATNRNGFVKAGMKSDNFLKLNASERGKVRKPRQRV